MMHAAAEILLFSIPENTRFTTVQKKLNKLFRSRCDVGLQHPHPLAAPGYAG
jgi:hypothetical protein